MGAPITSTIVIARPVSEVFEYILNFDTNGPEWANDVESVEKTGHLLAIDGGWSNCGMAAEIIAAVSERMSWGKMQSAPTRLNLTDAPAPSSGPLEKSYYLQTGDIVTAATEKLS